MGVRPNTVIGYSDGNFQDENGNAIDLRAAMNNDATIEIVVKREADGEYEAARTYGVLVSTVLVTVTMIPPSQR